MAKLVMTYIGMKDGMRAYAAMDAEDEALIGDQTNIVCEMVGSKAKATTLQKRSVYKYCDLLANKFNDGGLDMAAVFAVKEVSVDWTTTAVKESIWRPVQKVMFNSESLTKLEKPDIDKVYRVVSKQMSESFRIDQPFPSRYGD